MNRYTNVKITGVLCAFMVLGAGVANAQEDTKGRISGSYETNTMYYMPDDKVYNDMGNAFPKDRFGSNNYLKLDYTRGRFSAGIQGELYAPVIQGYKPAEGYQGARISNKYVSWTDDSFSVTVGDFYDQFGSGLIFRTYEDRALGFNNSLEGARVTYNYSDILSVKGIFGRPRLFTGYAPVWVRGADVSWSILSMFGVYNQYLALEGSYISKYDESREQYTDINDKPLLTTDMNAWSARLVYEVAGFSIKGELVGKAPSVYKEHDNFDEVARAGRGQLVELGYSGYGWGVSLTGRALRYMDMYILDKNTTDYMDLGLYNVLNYMPSLTRQYTYSLANLDPYVVNGEGERAAQADIYYNFRKKTALGGRYGTKLHLNGSIAYKPYNVIMPSTVGASDEWTFANLDASIDVEKQWNKKFKTTALFAYQRLLGKRNDRLYNRYVFVADMLYKFTPRNSLRLELQYLHAPWGTLTQEGEQRDTRDHGDWWAAMAEFSMAPRFSIFASDMYNYAYEKIHYYSFGVSYTKSSTRIALSYGRNRAGMVCSGGVCREMPAYTGFNLSITTSF